MPLAHLLQRLEVVGRIDQLKEEWARVRREHPEIVDKAAAAGRATYCWTVDDASDVDLCRELGVSWIATNYPGRTKSRLAG